MKRMDTNVRAYKWFQGRGARYAAAICKEAKFILWYKYQKRIKHCTAAGQREKWGWFCDSIIFVVFIFFPNGCCSWTLLAEKLLALINFEDAFYLG